MKKQNISRLGFTLIELLVVVLIIGILASVALPQYQKAVDKSRATEAWNILSTLERAEELKNIEQDTVGKFYNFNELDIELPCTNANPTTICYTNMFRYSYFAEPNKITATIGSTGALYLDGGKKVCLAENSKEEAWCKAILSSPQTRSGCLTVGTCFTE